MSRPKCCLCGIGIVGKKHLVPADPTGKRELPPDCARRAKEHGAPASDVLHNGLRLSGGFGCESVRILQHPKTLTNPAPVTGPAIPR